MLSMDNSKYNKGAAIGGITGAILTLILLWSRGNAPRKFLPMLLLVLICLIPWVSASLGNYAYKKCVSKPNDIKDEANTKK